MTTNPLNHKQKFNPNDVLKLEVEVDQPIKNLVPNPNGDLGAWGWSTPNANTTLEGYDPAQEGQPKHVLAMYDGERLTTGQIRITIVAQNVPTQTAISISRNTYLPDGDYVVLSQSQRTVSGVIGVVTDFFIADFTTATTQTNIKSGSVQIQSALVLTAVTSTVAYARMSDQPFTAGKYLQGRINVQSILVSHQMPIFVYFMDANHTVISTINTAVRVTTTGTFFFGPHQAPANTAYASIGLYLYNGSGTTPANVGAWVTFNNVQIVQSDTSGGVQQRTNLFTNPSFEANTTGFSAGSGVSIARDTTQHMFGVASGKYTKTGTPVAGQYAFYTPQIPLTTNTTYTLSFYVKASSTATLRFNRWFANDATWHTSYQDATINTAWKRITYTFNSGAYTALTALRWDIVGSQPTNLWFDGFLLEKGGLGNYFDGGLPPAGWTAVWNGTINNSASTASSPASHFDYVPPVSYQDILGSAYNVGIQRSELDVGTMQIGINDASLDPAGTDALRPGRRLRLMALDDDGFWTPLFTGKISNSHVDYKADKGRIKTNITITAIDAISDLANTSRPNGVAGLENVPWVLEGIDVPWNINGETGQVPQNPDVAYVNDDASALDQIAMVRDSPRVTFDEGSSYAWMDRYGIINLFEYNYFAAEGTAADLDEYVYNSNFVLDYDTDRCINEVTIKAQRMIAGETQEWTYGPFRDEASIRQWGTHSVEYNVAVALDEVVTDTYWDTFVADIFERNANPRVQMTSCEVPMNTTNDILFYGLLDLYDKVGTSNTPANYEATTLITGIEHVITPESWIVKYTFSSDKSVASPAVQPAVTASPADAAGWLPVTLASGYVGSSTSPQYRLKNGVVYLTGNVTQSGGTLAINTSPGHTIGTIPSNVAPSAQQVFLVATQNPNLSQARLFVLTDGTIKVYLSSSTTPYVSLAGAYPL